MLAMHQLRLIHYLPKLSYIGKKHFLDPQIHEFPLGHDDDVLMCAVRTMATFYYFFSFTGKPLNTHHNYLHVPCGDAEILVSL